MLDCRPPYPPVMPPPADGFPGMAGCNSMMEFCQECLLISVVCCFADAQYPAVMPPPADGFPGVAGCNSVWGVAGNDTCALIATKSSLANTAA